MVLPEYEVTTDSRELCTRTEAILHGFQLYLTLMPYMLLV